MMKEPLLLMNPTSGNFEAALTLNFPEATILSITLEVGSEKNVASEEGFVTVEVEKTKSQDGSKRLNHKLQVKVPQELAAKAGDKKLKTMTMVVNTE